MCGIYGFTNNKEKNFDKELIIKHMMKASSYRGPDNTSSFINDKVSLGHNRLSIIDLSSKANQPFHDLENNLTIVFNGEIYNYEKLRKELALKYTFHTNSDTEVLLKSYLEWGSECLNKLDGMFCFVIWNKQKDELFIARDYFGEKPLFYYFFGEQKNQNIVFASDLNSLAKGPYFNNQASIENLTGYVHNNYFFDNKTIYKKVFKFPKGCFGIFKNNELKISSYANQKNKLQNARVDFEYLEHLILNSVKSRMVSDVSVGVFLSGGLDSSLIAYYASKINKNINTYTLSFADKSFDETSKAKKISKFLNLRNQSYKLKNDDIDNLENIVNNLGEPLADSSIIPTFYLSKFARSSSKVCLSGDGGDEMFFGYTTYNASKLHKFISSYGLTKLFSISNNFIEKIPEQKSKVNFTYMLKKFFSSFENFKKNPHLFWRQVIFKKFHYGVFKPEIRNTIISQFENQFYNKNLSMNNDDLINNKLDFDTFLENDILVKTDRCSMANSLEVRSPFLNVKLKEYLDSIPLNQRYTLFSNKKILKKLIGNKFPKSIVNQNKRGFNAPISFWFIDKYAKLLSDLVHTKKINLFFDEEFVNFLISEHINKKKDYSLILFNILIFLIWSKRNYYYL